MINPDDVVFNSPFEILSTSFFEDVASFLLQHQLFAFIIFIIFIILFTFSIIVQFFDNEPEP
jgi:sterol desaturase/sphingolipid hydroxylase (fatty acid hydroxylase superfamily)